MVLGVVTLLVSDRMLLPPSTLLHVTVGCIDGSIGKVTLHSRAKFWPVIAEPLESTDMTGEGKPEGVKENYKTHFSTKRIYLTCDIEPSNFATG